MFTLSATAKLSERLKYSPHAVTPGELQDALERLERLETLIGDAGLDADSDKTFEEQIEAQVSDAVAKDCPDHAAYRQFFEDCFNALGDHYPCPEVTSEYDCSVIFDAIRLGEETREANEHADAGK